ncbi:hypothetical protein Py04_1595 [Pyrococcus sp. ST04]|nr:hypothetical protein Py04_1595 [Pyrococcus sp. ST04]
MVLATVALLFVHITDLTSHLKECHCECNGKKATGPVMEIGTFTFSAINIDNAVGRVIIKEGQGKVLSNVPVEVTNRNGTLIILCHNCAEYEEPVIIIESTNISKLVLGNVLGKLIVDVNVDKVNFENILGEVRISSARKVVVENVLGELDVKVLESFEAENVLGEVNVVIPKNAKPEISVSRIIGKFNNNAGNEGNFTVRIKVQKLIGKLTVEK